MLNKDKQRELAYVVKVDTVEPIDGYDRIKWATVRGWHCVVGTDISEGDLCVYFEVDSLLPSNDKRFEFCERYKYKVKEQKYCKGTRISCGLLMPISAFPELKKCKEGDFVTNTLGVTYYDPMDSKRKSNISSKDKLTNSKHKNLLKKPPFKWLMRTEAGRKILLTMFGLNKKKEEYPWFIKKTDEERCQNLSPDMWADKQFEITEKIDGTSSSFGVERGRFGRLKFYVCSRNVVLTRNKSAFYDTNFWFEMYDKYNIEKFLTEYIKETGAKWVYLQGETFGDGVQKRNYSMKNKRDFRAFILCDSRRERFSYTETEKILARWNIPTVPIISSSCLLPNNCDSLIELAHGDSAIDGLPREGLVLRSVSDPTFSFKAVDPEFIIKYHG